MPARRDYTPEELQARLERRREQTRLAVARHRAGKHDGKPHAEAVSLTEGQVTGGKRNPPTPPVPPPTSLEVEGVGRVLARFADRGYEHDPESWRRLARKHPQIDLYLEARNLAGWLEEHPKEKCSSRRIVNWLKRAQADIDAGRVRTPSTARAPGRPPDPDPVLPADVVLERIDPRVAQRALAAAKRLTLPEKLALVTNGRQA